MTEWRFAELGEKEFMACMNVTDMDAMGAFMNSPEELQWDKDNGCEYTVYGMEEMTEQPHCIIKQQILNLIAIDINLKLISKRLGHKSIQITMDRYGHLLKKSDERMRNALEALQADLK